MYWWNVSKLAEDFQQDRVDEKERFKYCLATFVLWTALIELAYYSGGTLKLLNFMDSVATMAITIIGIILCYRANKSGDNMDFIGRMICLGWPISVKILVLFSIFWAIFYLVIGRVSADSDVDLVGDIVGVIASIFFSICYYWLNYKYINIVSQSHMVKDLES
jgi:ABC-type multidrug transport system fused ATPase/permease subunit